MSMSLNELHRQWLLAIAESVVKTAREAGNSAEVVPMRQGLARGAAFSEQWDLELCAKGDRLAVTIHLECPSEGESHTLRHSYGPNHNSETIASGVWGVIQALLNLHWGSDWKDLNTEGE